MNTPAFPDHLRCPLGPDRQTRLEAHEDHLLCPVCGLRYSIRDGIPNLIIEEAQLPEGCTSLERAAERHVSPDAPVTPAL
jgi:uncharacterized protein YbaR (Trm112 family)